MTEPAAGLEAGQVCMFGKSKAREAMVILRAPWVSWGGFVVVDASSWPPGAYLNPRFVSGLS